MGLRMDELVQSLHLHYDAHFWTLYDVLYNLSSVSKIYRGELNARQTKL